MMLFHLLLLLMASITLTQGYALPEQAAPDTQVGPRFGIIDIDQLSSVDLRQLSPQNVSAQSSPAPPSSQVLWCGWPFICPKVTIYCGCGFGLNHDHCDLAVRHLKDQLGLAWDGGAPIPNNGAFWSIEGDVVAFVCNHSGGDARIQAEEFYGEALKRITKACGWYTAGTWSADRDQALDMGYMRYRPGLNFCHDATTSPAHSC